MNLTKCPKCHLEMRPAYHGGKVYLWWCPKCDLDPGMPASVTVVEPDQPSPLAAHAVRLGVERG